MYNKKLIEEWLEFRKTKIDELTDVFVEHTEHTNDKFYKLGFYDAINLILGGMQNGIR